MNEGHAQHTSSRFDQELERLRTRVLHMGGLTEELLGQATGVLVRGTVVPASLIAGIEREVNELERSLDEDCGRILATRAPAAIDLRFVVAVLKAATDLERIGDESKKIVHLSARLMLMEPTSRFTEVRHLASSVSLMLRDTLHAFARQDADAALQIAGRDRLIDEEFEAIQRQSVTFMLEDPRAIRRSIDVMWVIRALERIGDHCQNLCEHVTYIVRGKDVRHRFPPPGESAGRVLPGNPGPPAL